MFQLDPVSQAQNCRRTAGVRSFIENCRGQVFYYHIWYLYYSIPINFFKKCDNERSGPAADPHNQWGQTPLFFDRLAALS